MCTVFLSAVRRALPQAQVAVDLFHVVQLAVKAAGDVRRRATREKYGRRGKEGDPEYGLKGLLNRNLESLSAAQFAQGHRDPGRRRARPGDRDRLDREGETPRRPEPPRAHPQVTARASGRSGTGSSPSTTGAPRTRPSPSSVTLAATISRWEEQIVTAVLTGVTNATSESLNRLAKLEARLAYGFRNPASQRRRVRTACTRGTRRRSPTATSTTKQPVISRQQVPG